MIEQQLFIHVDIYIVYKHNTVGTILKTLDVLQFVVICVEGRNFRLKHFKQKAGYYKKVHTFRPLRTRILVTSSSSLLPLSRGAIKDHKKALPCGE